MIAYDLHTTYIIFFLLGQTDEDEDIYIDDGKNGSHSSLDLSAHETQIHEESDWKGPMQDWELFFYLNLFWLSSSNSSKIFYLLGLVFFHPSYTHYLVILVVTHVNHLLTLRFTSNQLKFLFKSYYLWASTIVHTS